MAQTETTQVKVQIDANGLRYEAAGPIDEIVPQILQFLTKAIPTYNLASKILYVPNLSALTDKVSSFAKMTTNGQLLLTRSDVPADRSILIVLFMAHLVEKMGKRDEDSLSIEEVANAVAKASKTIRNVIVNLQKSGTIERVQRGNYRITSKGLLQLESTILDPEETGTKELDVHQNES